MGEEAVHGAESGVSFLRLGEIEPNADQPRKNFKQEALEELADSMRTHGVLQPLTVRRLPSGYYQIVDGERRWRAARLAGLSSLPVRVFEADDRAAAEMALIHNLQREDLAPLEEAQGFRRLMEDYGLTQEEAAARVGKSRPAVANALRLLALCPTAQALLQQEKISAGHARALLSLSGAALQEKAAKCVAAEGLSVRQTEALVKKLSAAPPKKKTAKTEERERQIDDLQRRIGQELGRRVTISHTAKKGRIMLEYYGLDDLDNLLAQLQLTTNE